MKKWKLDLDDLQVESFDPTPEDQDAGMGTVFGFSATIIEYTCLSCNGTCISPTCDNTCGPNTCLTCGNTCLYTCFITCPDTCLATCGGPTCDGYRTCFNTCQGTCIFC